MLEHLTLQLTLFFMLYGGAIAAALILCVYLLFGRGNAIAPGVTPPTRLRRWAAALYGVSALGHLWWFLFFILSGDIRSWAYMACTVLDSVLMLVTIVGTLLSMLQDHRRPMWPVFACTLPMVILGGLQIVWPATDFIPIVIVYMLSVFVLFSIYMAVAVRQYGRWLRDNYADLERKEVWLSHTLLILYLLMLTIYSFATDDSSLFLIRIADFVMFALLLWRVETLPQLEVETNPQPLPVREGSGSREEQGGGSAANIGQLLQEKCENTGLYLMHDMTLTQLSAVVGVNRFYLSQYFSSQGMNYNTYINDLRISHFVSLYEKALASKHSFTALQLAQESGYRSYSTFSTVFKQRMGQSVSAWMRDASE